MLLTRMVKSKVVKFVSGNKTKWIEVNAILGTSLEVCEFNLNQTLKV